MNFSLDAIWWKLKTKELRDLASLLLSPPLWHTGCEIPVKTLLGNQGFRYLLDLDENPSPLLNSLKNKHSNKKKLGFYAEDLMHFWFSHAPHSRLIAHQLKVKHSNNIEHELDYIVELNQVIYHIELTCKYYYSLDTINSEMIKGIHRPSDHFLKKYHKLKKQLYPSEKFLADFMKKNQISQLYHQSLVRGILFVASERNLSFSHINQYCWQGNLIQEIELSEKKNLVPLDKNDYLSPLRLNKEERQHKLTRKENCMVWAQLEQRPDHFFHEVQRFFILPH